jgi:uncharacterized protein (TIGR03437 family)
MRTFRSQFSSPWARRRPHFAALEIAALILYLAAGSLPSRAVSACLAPPSGLVSWWPGDTNNDDIAGSNNPNASSAITLVPAEVLDGFSFGTNGYLQIPASPSLANQNFTWAAWVKPNGPGPNNDSYGSTIVEQDIDGYDLSVALFWRSSPDNRFVFVFGNTSTEMFTSTDTFTTGSFYHVAATYDGSVFRLFVNAVAEGSFAEAKSVPYSTNPWDIGSAGLNGISVDYPRTLNGVVDEVQAFDRALSQSELESIYNAGAAGECKNGEGTSPVTGTPVSEIVNAASYANPALPNSGVAQGSLFTIFGKNLGPSKSPSTAFPLSTTLGGVTISVSQDSTTVPAIPLFVGPTQINAIMPSTAPLGTDSVTVTYQGQTSTGSVQVVASSFGILTFNSSGNGQALSTNDSYALIDYNSVAHPGEYLTLWGTGLGAISGGDANPPPVGNITANNPIVYVGGTQVTPIYHGRSSCCGGVDQVIFTLPANVTGCNVPVAVQIGNTISNFVSVAIASSGSTCTDPGGLPYSDLASWGTQGSATIGNIVYEAYNDTSPSVLGILGGGGTAVSSGTEEIASFYKNQFTNLTALAPILNTGACTVYAFTGTSAPDPGVYSSTGLDAGTPLTATEGDEQGQIKESSTTGVYTELFDFPAGSLTFAGPGGKSVGAFDVTFPVGPENLNWSNESGISTIARSSGVKVTWTGADPGSTVQITGYSIGGASTSSAAGAGFTCTASGSAGEFTVPASILQALPASADFSNSILPIATGSLGISSRSAAVSFSAKGLDYGRAYTESEFSNSTVIYQ